MLTIDMQKAMDSLNHVQEEMDKLLADYSETLQAAQQYGINNDHSSDSRLVASDIPDQGAEVSGGQEAGDNVPHPLPPVSDNKLEQDMFRQLKRVSIPVFSGNKHAFESWKAAFTACIDKSPSSAM